MPSHLRTVLANGGYSRPQCSGGSNNGSPARPWWFHFARIALMSASPSTSWDRAKTTRSTRSRTRRDGRSPAATQSTYGAARDRPSSRVRDLVDLVVFARSQDVDGDALINAIRAEWNHQGLAGDPLFDPPVHWRRLYPPLARTVRKCEGLTTFPSAVELVGRFLGPALDGSAAGRRWSLDLARWEPGLEVHSTENP